MGFTSAWSISCHEDSVVADLAPRTAAAVEADRTCPRARHRRAAWRRAPLPDHRSLIRPDRQDSPSAPNARPAARRVRAQGRLRWDSDRRTSGVPTGVRAAYGPAPLPPP
ncbi:hypothetical protein [Streptomyces virginiae]|uniref:hypothetical protein n=1 Tax=Streptomyces virginiae TaxID=1961 RepID=UPI00333015C3